MRRWDLVLAVGIVLLVIAACGIDWRAGTAIAGVSLVGVWYWLADDDDEVTS